MAHLAHTEYVLRGRSTLDVREVLRETMFAPTVTGRPVRERLPGHRAARAGRGRGYYAGVLALLGRDAGGRQTLDSPILIRTADIDPPTAGCGCRSARRWCAHSDPRGEVAETHAKAAGVLAALGVRAGAGRDAGPARGRGSRTTRGCGPRWTRAAPTSRRSGCGCGDPAAADDPSSTRRRR